MILMRDKNQTTLLNFKDQIENFLEKKIQTIEILRTAVVDNPTLLEDFLLENFPKKLYQIKGLCILFHYIEPEPLRFKFLFKLEEEIKRYSLKEQRELKLLIYSKEICLKFLFETKKYSSHEIFGNILHEGIRSLRLIKLRRKIFKINKPNRKRGYHDKGSLRSQDRWLPSYDYTLTELQNKKEYETNLHLKTIDFLIKYLKRI